MDQQDHRAQYREAPEPEEGTRATPKFVLVWIAILIVWGVGYYAWQIGKPLLGGDSRTPVAGVSQQEAEPAEMAASGSSAATEKPDGGATYTAQCSACHQATGKGIPGAFPPLAGSEWLVGDADISIAILHDGLQGAIEVAGNTYQGVMPKFGGKLSNAEIAAVLSHIRSQWGNEASEITPAAVAEHNERFGEREAWSADELIEVFGKP